MDTFYPAEFSNNQLMVFAKLAEQHRHVRVVHNYTDHAEVLAADSNRYSVYSVERGGLLQEVTIKRI
jgi:hypothetical protein